MHVLRQLHKTLRANGLLLDIHPQPLGPRVLVLHDGRSVPVGSVGWSQDSDDVRQARKRLVSVQRAGLFRTEARRTFTWRMYHDSVDAWLQYRRDRNAKSTVSEELLRKARRQMRAEGARLVVVDRVRASVFRRLPSRR